MSRAAIDPVADAETIETELMLADLESVERACRIQRKLKGGDKDSAGSGAAAEARAGGAGIGQARPHREGRRRRPEGSGACCSC
jgi:ribosome-binding ATPase YchF (GTP1/OBG family)